MAVVLEEGDSVRAVGLTTWLSPFDGLDRLDPGGIPVPPNCRPKPVRWTQFHAANRMDDVVFVSALDGQAGIDQF